MRVLVRVLLALLITLPLRAQDSANWLENGDFSDGINHWYGGGRSPADYANDNPLGGSDPFISKGLIIPLDPQRWTKVNQDFKGKVSSGIYTIVYKVSQDFAFSTKPEDYTNTPEKIGFRWKPFDTPQGAWDVLLADMQSTHGYIYNLKPKLGSSEPQTYRGKVTGMTPFENKTITLAFPPGKGTLVVLSVSIVSQ